MDVQCDILRVHMAVAARHQRPVTLHCVGAWGRLLEAIQANEAAHSNNTNSNSISKINRNSSNNSSNSNSSPSGVRAYVLHSCNSLPPEMVPSFAAIPTVYFSLTGRALGAKESRLARAVPTSRLLIETDSPDQLHGSLRGRLACNEPALVRYTCVLLAQVLGVDPNELADTTAANARRVFDF
jgi:TatD DNase family protein